MEQFIPILAAAAIVGIVIVLALLPDAAEKFNASRVEKWHANGGATYDSFRSAGAGDVIDYVDARHYLNLE